MAGCQKGRSSHHAGHQRQTNRQKRDRQKKYRITDKQMNNDQILTETMDIDRYSYLLTTKCIKPRFVYRNTWTHWHKTVNTQYNILT